MVARAPHGSGDLFAALFLAHLLQAQPLAALERALASVTDVLAASDGMKDLALIANQDRLVAPRTAVTIEALG